MSAGGVCETTCGTCGETTAPIIGIDATALVSGRHAIGLQTRGCFSWRENLIAPAAGHIPHGVPASTPNHQRNIETSHKAEATSMTFDRQVEAS